MITLTTTIPLGNANRWRAEKATPHDDVGRLVVTIQLISNGSVLIAEKEINIENYVAGASPPATETGRTDRISITSGPTRFVDSLQVEPRALALPTGYVDALAAWRSGGTTAQRRAALETWMLANGVAGANMAGA